MARSDIADHLLSGAKARTDSCVSACSTDGSDRLTASLPKRRSCHSEGIGRARLCVASQSELTSHRRRSGTGDHTPVDHTDHSRQNGLSRRAVKAWVRSLIHRRHHVRNLRLSRLQRLDDLSFPCQPMVNERLNVVVGVFDASTVRRPVNILIPFE